MRWPVGLALLLLAVPASAQIPEGTNTWWPVDFVDQNNVPVAPETAAYYAEALGDIEHPPSVLIASTALPTPIASSVVIAAPTMIVPNLNARNPDFPLSLVSTFTVHFCWAGGTKCANSQRPFTLLNQPGWP